MNKIFLIITTLILVSLIGLVIFSLTRLESTPLLQESDQSSSIGTVSVLGKVINTDVSGAALDGPVLITITDDYNQEHIIAIPSMGIRLCAAADTIADAWEVTTGDLVSVRGEQNEEGQIVPCVSTEHFFEVTGSHEDSELGYKFLYTKGPDGYVVVENEESLGSNFLGGVTIFNRAQYEEFENSTDAREGPPAIAVQVFENESEQTVSEWAMENSSVSNYELAVADPEEITVSGASGIQYVADGLWYTDVQIIAHDGRIYVLIGMIPDDFAAMREEYSNILDSFEFILI